MKNLFKYAVLSGVVAVAAACTKDNTVDAVGPRAEYRMTNITIEAQTVDADSRTTVEGNALVWQDKDSEQSIAAVELWDGELTDGVDGSFDSYRVQEAKCASVEDGKALFNATVAGKSGDDDGYTRGYIAAYPYAAFASVSGTNVEMTLPAEQTPAAVDDIDPAATLLFASDIEEGYTATPESLSLWFKHVAAYGRIRLYNLNLGSGEKLAKVVIISNNENKYLSGNWKFDYTDEEPAGEYGNEIYNSINLNVADLDTEAVADTEGVKLWFAALPCGEIDSFTVKAVTDRGLEYTKQIDNSLTFNRKAVEAFGVNFEGIDPVLPEESATKLNIVAGWANQAEYGNGYGDYSIKKLFDNDFESAFHSPYAVGNGNCIGTVLPVDVVLELESASSVSYLKYYTTTGSGRPGKFDIYLRTLTNNGINDIPAIDGKGGAENPMYDLNEAEGDPHTITLPNLVNDVIAVKMIFYSGANGFVSGREIEIFGAAGTAKSEQLKIASGYTVEYQAGEGIENLFDGIKDSDSDSDLYHSDWYNTVFPIELIFRFESVSSISHFYYYARENNSNGLPEDFDVEYRTLTSTGVSDWIPAIANKDREDRKMYYMGMTTNNPNVIYFPNILEDVADIKLTFYKDAEGAVLSGREIEFFGKITGTDLHKLNITNCVADSEEVNDEYRPASKLIDGVIEGADHFHSNWSSVGTSFPFNIEFTLASAADLSHILYYTRDSGNNGIPGKFDVYYKTAGSDWILVSEDGKGGSADNAMYDMGAYYMYYPYNIFFQNIIENATAVRLTFYTGYSWNGGDGYISGREVEFYGWE